jgi:hypothetical protein
MNKAAAILLLALVLGTGATERARAQGDGVTESPDGQEAVKVYYTPEQALAKVFAKADSVWVETWQPTTAELAAVEARLGWQVAPGPVQIHRGRNGEQDLGYAVITAEKGRFKPITFLVKVGPNLQAEMVLVMVYRESRGDGVKRQRFLKQFRKKDADSPLRLNRDIVGVSGATMSSRGVTAGVKRVLALMAERYGQEGAP